MTEDLRSDLSEAVRWLRERIGLSREQLAAASGVSAVHIKFIERGKRNPSEAVIQRLLPALRVTRRDLDGLLSLRPWASTTTSGDPATLATYAAGVPLAVEEGSEFNAALAPAPIAGSPPAPIAGSPPAPMAMRSASMPSAPAGQRLDRGAYRPVRTAAPAAEPAPQRPTEPATLDAELIELRERYVHLPRSKQAMVLGWLRALDDR